MTVAAQLMAYDPNAVKPGWIAFFIVMIMLAATVLLVLNMNRQLHKIKVPFRSEFGGPPPRRRFINEDPAAPASTDQPEESDREPDRPGA